MSRRQVSDVWTDFERTGDGVVARCKLCASEVRYCGNTTNLKNLNRRHPTHRITKKPTGKSKKSLNGTEISETEVENGPAKSIEDESKENRLCNQRQVCICTKFNP